MSAPLISRPPLRRPVPVVTSVLVAIGLLLGGCGGDDDGNVVADAVKDDRLPTQPAAPESSTTAPQDCESVPEPPTPEDKPTVEVPAGEAPTELVSEDLRPGDGPEIAAGDSVMVQYTGVAFASKMEFDTSWDDLMALPVTVGSGGVVPGFDQGLVGLKLGGRRQLVLPPDLAYGEEGQPPDIGPNETLVFVVDAVEVCKPGEGAEGGSTTAPAEGGSTTAPAEDGSTTAPPEDESTTAPAEGGSTTAPPEDESTTVPAEEGSTTTAAG